MHLVALFPCYPHPLNNRLQQLSASSIANFIREDGLAELLQSLNMQVLELLDSRKALWLHDIHHLLHQLWMSLNYRRFPFVHSVSQILNVFVLFSRSKFGFLKLAEYAGLTRSLPPVYLWKLKLKCVVCLNVQEPTTR